MHKNALLLLLAGAALAALSLGWTLMQPDTDLAQDENRAANPVQMAASQPDKTQPDQTQPDQTGPSKTGASKTGADGAEAEKTGPAEPFISLSVVRVDPDGNAVIAGTSLPDAEIIISEGGQELVRTRADQNGEWVAIPEKPLSPGSHLLSLQMQLADGRQAMADAGIVVEIAKSAPDREKQTPLVALVPQDATAKPQLIQSPDSQPAAKTENESASKIASEIASETASDQSEQPALAAPLVQIRSLFWLDGDQLRIEGLAVGGARVVARLSDQASGDILPGPSGSWSWQADISQLGSGSALLEAELLDENGRSLAAARLPVSSARLALGKDGKELVVIQKGDMLWRIAFRSYGSGVRFVDIVRANPGRIGDPDLIYPNQIFALPETGQ